MRRVFRGTFTLPDKIREAGDWMAERLGIPRKEVFRQFRTASLVEAHAADDPALAVEVERES